MQDVILQNILIAPYSPVGSAVAAPGAATKIEIVARLLIRLGRLRIVNSGHDKETWASGSARRAPISLGNRAISQILPSRWPNRKLGKAINLLEVGCLARRLQRPPPVIIWIYNCYSFEVLLARAVMKRSSPVLIVQLEDWPTARRRSWLNIKPIIDSCFMEWTIRRANLVLCVNKPIYDRVLASGPANCRLMPGLFCVEEAKAVAATAKPPFSATPFRLGYFGSLAEEKGGTLLIALARNMPEGWQLIVGGTGEMANEFRRLQSEDERAMRYLGAYEKGEDVRREMTQCDVIINPHRSIEELRNGIFPSKVLEAVAYGRLVLSTKLPSCGLALQPAVRIFDGTVEGVHQGLEKMVEEWPRIRNEVSGVVELVRERCSDEALLDTVKKIVTGDTKRLSSICS